MTSRQPLLKPLQRQHVMDFKDLSAKRRSHRRFSPEPVDQKDIDLIVRAALLSPTSKNRRDWKFIVVTEKETIADLSRAKDHGAELLAGAPLAIVVIGNPSANDCWVEDCSIAAVTMQYQSEDLGLGSCWVQMRGRGVGDVPASAYIRELLSLDEDDEVLCVLAIGRKLAPKDPHDEDSLKFSSVKYL